MGLALHFVILRRVPPLASAWDSPSEAGEITFRAWGSVLAPFAQDGTHGVLD
jgi:hypothetical protein